MPLKEGCNMRQKIIKSVGKLFLYSTIHPYAHILLNFILYVEVLAILLGLNMIESLRLQIMENSVLQGIILLLVIVQCVLVVMLIVMVLIQKGQANENVYILEYQSHLFKVIQKFVSVMLLAYRKVLALPIFVLSYAILHAAFQPGAMPSTLAVINLVFAAGILHPLSGIIFSNKVTSYQNITAFPYKLNIESLLYVYMPICIFLYIYQPAIIAYVSLMFSLFCFGIMFIRPIIMYRQNKIALAGISSVNSAIFLKGFYFVLNMEAKTPTNILLFILISIIFAVVLYLYQTRRTKTILLSKPQNTLFSRIVHCNFNEILFYHILNYDTESSSLLLFLIAYNERNNQKKANQKSKQGSQKSILAKKQIFLHEKQCEKSIKQIIDELKTKNMRSKEIQKLFSEFLLNYFKSFYNPDHFLDENMGVKQLNDKITHFQGYSIIISQILMLESSDLRKCYTFLRLHEKLLNKINYLGLMESIEIYCSLSVIEQDLKVKGKISDSYSVKAEKYFVFEQVYESLKNNILQSCDNRIVFWQEHQQNQIHCEKLKQMIHKNFSLSKKIEATSSKILEDFPSKSPIILFDLIASYSTQILNKKIYSTLSPFYSMVKKYKEELEFQKKQGALMMDNSSIKNFSLLQNIGVCMIDLEHKPGKIQWGNQYFWTDFYLAFVHDKDSKDANPNIEHGESLIFDLMVPELESRHLTYFKDFSSSSLLNQDHDVAFLYQRWSKIFERVNIEIQIFPSLLNGLKVTAFIAKTNLWDQLNFEKSAILISEDLSVLGYSKQFICLKSLLTENDINSLSIKNGDKSYLCQQLIELQTFTQLLKRPKPKEKNQIEFKIGFQTFLITLVKVYKDFAQKQRTIIEEFVSRFEERQFATKVYLLEITPMVEKKKEESSSESDEYVQKFTNFLASTLSHSANYENKSQNSIYTSFNSCNIDRALSLVPDVEKHEELENQHRDEKSDQILSMQKKYRIFMFSKNSKKIRNWIYFTFFIIVLLCAAMIANIMVFNLRQSLYEESKSKIQYYYEILTDICQIIIALREYNFYVYLNGPTDPHVPYLINKIASEQGQVNYKLKYVAKQMGDRWPVIEIKNHFNYTATEEQDFIVIANYMLSSMTYISQIDPQQLSFPIFISKIDPDNINPTILNFNQAVYNGIYVVADKMVEKRPVILASILNSFDQPALKYYLYPCIAGILLLFVFSIVSIHLERKSESIRLKAVQLLGKVGRTLKDKKMQKLLQFKHKNGFIEVQQKKPVKRTSAVNYMAQTLSTVMLPPPNSQFMSQLTKGRDSQLKVLKTITDEIKEVEEEHEYDTKRDLFGNQITDLEPASVEGEGHKKTPKKQVMQERQEEPGRQIDLPFENAERLKVLFYMVIIAPILVYFVITIIWGAKIDSNMVQNFELFAQIYTRKTNEETTLLLARENFYFEPFLSYDYSWTQTIIDGIEDSLHHFRKLQGLIYQNDIANNLRGLLQMIKNGNLCNQMYKFSQSQYLEVKFSTSECSTFSHGILTKGLKQTETLYYETAMFILSNTTNTTMFSYDDRIKYLQLADFNTMKVLLGYEEQFSNMMSDAFEEDFQNYAKKFLSQNVIYSVVSIFTLGLLLLAIKYRWGFVNKQRKQIVSIVEIVSLESIKAYPSLTRLFDGMELNFYK